MSDFTIDKQLLADCHPLMSDSRCHYLLHGNAGVDWFIIVPATAETEFYHLPADLQMHVCQQIARVSEFVHTRLNADKINVATLGNVVSQLHVHVVGRFRDDPYWPDPVWGRPLSRTHTEKSVTLIRRQFVEFM